MNIVFRRSLLLTLALVLLAGFGCAKKQVDHDDYYDELAMTESERLAAQRIADGVIYFAFDRYDLSAEARRTLTQTASVMKEVPQLRVTIEGHCDERGTEEYNLALGERRARAAYEFLVNLGVPPRQMEMVSFGKLRPAVMGNNEAAWAKNRRAEFKAYKPRQ
jgi:peptidoglycan-associated lipoprotein